jgi:hypothetical protein
MFVFSDFRGFGNRFRRSPRPRRSIRKARLRTFGAGTIGESLRSLNDLAHFIKNMIKLQICDFILAKNRPKP